MVESRSLAQVPHSRIWALIFLAPALILFGLLVLWPIARGAYNSFTEWSGFGQDQDWIGLANYIDLQSDPRFWGALRNSFYFMVMNVPIRLALALGLAILLNNRHLKGRTFFRTMVFLPVVTTTAIVGVLMTFVFNPYNGPVNLALLGLGLVERPIAFLGESQSALVTIVLVSIWKWAGVTLIYWLAALQSVPQSLEEAAQVDGANRWQTFRHITAPLIVPFAMVILLISAINMLQVFDLVQTMTGGGPFFSTEVMEVYIYREGFTAGVSVPRLGYASAAALLFGILVMSAGILYGVALRRASSRRRDTLG